jgi:hypothetical protein
VRVSASGFSSLTQYRASWGNKISREIVSMVASLPLRRRGYMGMIRLAFTLRFIVYTLSILLTAALPLTVVAYPPAIDLAAVPLVVFAGARPER